MKTKLSLPLAGLLLLLLSCAALLGPAAPAEAQEVHALIIILGNDMNIRASVEKSESHLKELMGLVSAHCPVQLTVLKSEDELTGSVTKMSIVAGEARGIDKKDQGLIKGKHVSDWLNGLHPAAEDTVLIYYNGHGELRSFDNAHVLKFAESDVPRDLLRTELEKKPGRLKMLITDTCSKKADDTGEELVAQHLATIQGKGQRYTRNLFLEHTGILDMTAASPGELAWGNNKVGGYFTASLIKSFRGTSDKNSDDFLEWREVFPVCVSETEKLYEDTDFTLIQKNLLKREGQTTQQPVAHSLPTRLASNDSGQPAVVVVEVETTATLNVTSKPDGATVYVDGTAIGTTPLTYEVELGFQTEKAVKVGLSLEGYKQKLAHVTLKRGQQATWSNVTLEKKAVQIPQRITGNDGAEMVLIPAGQFQMGSNDAEGEADEQPVHSVHIDAFFMDKHEVTNAQFKAFVDANPQWRKGEIAERFHDGNYLAYWRGNDYRAGRANHPVIRVSWYAAMAYAEWAGKRLPTEAEWEYAARGGLAGKKYPWGDTITSSDANYGDVGDTTPVGQYAANGYGLYDMAGNVWEWCLDAYDGDFYAASENSRNPIAGGETIQWLRENFTSIPTNSLRVLRGGNFVKGSSTRSLRVADRCEPKPTSTGTAPGFRCVRAVTP